MTHIPANVCQVVFYDFETILCIKLGCFELSYTGDVSIARLGTDGFYTKNNLAKRFGATFSQ